MTAGSPHPKTRSHRLRSHTDAVALGLLAFAAAGVVGLLTGPHHPMVHDEFAYLLMAETFAEGRLTNPTPPFWEHLETYHVLMQPSYMGKYPPGQGLMLAVGALLGTPIVGVWLSVGLMVGATAWLAQAWLSRGWALLTGVAMMLQLGLAGQWAQSYWGGALAAAGGALLFGAFRRAWARPSAPLGVVGAIALLILANTRPLEGFVTSLPVLVGGLLIPARVGKRRFLAATITTMAIGTAWMGVYNHAVTGQYTRMPYSEYHEQYAVAPNFIPSSPRTPAPDYRHPEFRDFWEGWDLARYHEMRTLPGFVKSRASAILRLVIVLLGGSALGLLLLRGAKDRWLGVLALGSVPPVLLTLLTKGAHPHYLAPVAPLLILLAVAGWANQPPGSQRLRRYLGAVAVTLLLWAPVAQQHVRASRVASAGQAQAARAAFEDCLTRLEYSSVVLVDYLGDFGHYDDWIRNQPTPFSSPVTWARSMDPARDEALMQAFPDRAFWDVEITRYGDDLTVSGRLLRLPGSQAASPSQIPGCTPGI